MPVNLASNTSTAWLMQETQAALRLTLTEQRSHWLVTGVAGFIGSNLLEVLLMLDQDVRGIDNFATGSRRNLEAVRERVGAEKWGRFNMVEMDIRDAAACRAAVDGTDYVLHQAALGSVPRSIADPLTTHAVNVSGFLNMIDAVRQSRVKRFVYAASSSTYGDEPNLPKREDRIGAAMSPYGATKLIDEIYASIYARSFGVASVGLRYFNVFGPRQDPEGAYAAVIPKWVDALIMQDPVTINGDGETSRDFCFVANVVQANLRAALCDLPGHTVYNVALGDRTSLNELFALIRAGLRDLGVPRSQQPIYRAERAGDVRHSQADIARARLTLHYEPTHTLRSGLGEALPWYLARHSGLAGQN